MLVELSLNEGKLQKPFGNLKEKEMDKGEKKSKRERGFLAIYFMFCSEQAWKQVEQPCILGFCFAFFTFPFLFFFKKETMWGTDSPLLSDCVCLPFPFVSSIFEFTLPNSYLKGAHGCCFAFGHGQHLGPLADPVFAFPFVSLVMDCVADASMAKYFHSHLT